MAVPDKVYLAFEDGFVAQTSTIKEDANGNNIFLPEYIPIEYIRKDAILEWAKKNNERINTEEGDYTLGSMADLERTFECNPEKLPQWLKNKLAKKHLEGYIKGQEDAEKQYNESVAYHFPIMPTPPSGWGCDGTHCTNPHGDCINCPKRFTTGGTITTPNTACGTSAATLHGNTSATDGKEHNPSFEAE